MTLLRSSNMLKNLQRRVARRFSFGIALIASSLLLGMLNLNFSIFFCNDARAGAGAKACG